MAQHGKVLFPTTPAGLPQPLSSYTLILYQLFTPLKPFVWYQRYVHSPYFPCSPVPPLPLSLISASASRDDVPYGLCAGTSSSLFTCYLQPAIDFAQFPQMQVIVSTLIVFFKPLPIPAAFSTLYFYMKARAMKVLECLITTPECGKYMIDSGMTPFYF